MRLLSILVDVRQSLRRGASPQSASRLEPGAVKVYLTLLADCRTNALALTLVCPISSFFSLFFQTEEQEAG